MSHTGASLRYAAPLALQVSRATLWYQARLCSLGSSYVMQVNLGLTIEVGKYNQ